MGVSGPVSCLRGLGALVARGFGCVALSFSLFLSASLSRSKPLAGGSSLLPFLSSQMLSSEVADLTIAQYFNDTREIDIELLSAQQNASSHPINLVLQSPASAEAGFNAANTPTFSHPSLPFDPTDGTSLPLHFIFD